MIAAETVAEVRRLLRETPLSHRKIARLTGVSRGLVDAVASGKRPDREIAPPSEEEEPTGPPARCPDCGGMVYLPCRACQVRLHHETKTRNHRVTFAMQPLGLELRPEHRTRYEQVQRWRREGVCAPCSS